MKAILFTSCVHLHVSHSFKYEEINLLTLKKNVLLQLLCLSNGESPSTTWSETVFNAQNRKLRWIVGEWALLSIFVRIDRKRWGRRSNLKYFNVSCIRGTVSDSVLFLSLIFRSLRSFSLTFPLTFSLSSCISFLAQFLRYSAVPTAEKTQVRCMPITSLAST